jgi:hypothetical protein
MNNFRTHCIYCTVYTCTQFHDIQLVVTVLAHHCNSRTDLGEAHFLECTFNRVEKTQFSTSMLSLSQRDLSVTTTHPAAVWTIGLAR